MRLMPFASMVALFGFVAPAHAETPVVATPAELPRLWTPAAPVTSPVYPVELVEKAPSGCVTIGYVIEQDGTTSSLVELARYSSVRLPAAKVVIGEAFARAAASAIAMWRFVPAAPPVRTFTASTVNFSMDGTLPPPEKCRVDDLARQQGRSERRIAEMARMQWEQLNRERPEQMESYREPPPAPEPPAPPEPPQPDTGSGNGR